MSAPAPRADPGRAEECAREVTAAAGPNSRFLASSLSLSGADEPATRLRHAITGPGVGRDRAGARRARRRASRPGRAGLRSCHGRRAAHAPSRRRDPPLLPLSPSTWHRGRPLRSSWSSTAAAAAPAASRRTPASASSPSARLRGGVPAGAERAVERRPGYAATHDDVGFVRALLDTLERELSIDPRRVYATGSRTERCSPTAWRATSRVCSPRWRRCGRDAGRPRARLRPHAAGERARVPGHGGSAHALRRWGIARRRGRVLSAEQSIAFWATTSGCAAAPVTTDEPDRVTDGTRVRRAVYGACRRAVGRALHDRGRRHTWPGGPPVGGSVGRVTQEIDATAGIWAFFAEHPKP